MSKIMARFLDAAAKARPASAMRASFHREGNASWREAFLLHRRQDAVVKATALFQNVSVINGNAETL
ncbi:hypothetical protein ACHMW4_13975 [Mesorhizobium sp. UC22_110]|uniref:hypothetical protein n=1 Tax=unclassified Mesorhizobium TaxID=325217 RepID=UPI00367207EA